MIKRAENRHRRRPPWTWR